LVTAYLSRRSALALCVFLVDARHEPMEGDLRLREYLEHQDLPYVVAATKCDKLGRSESLRRREALRKGLGRGALDVLAVSGTTGEGVDQLWRTIRAALTPPGRQESHGR
jgi:GTP-binding protein